MKMEFKEYRMMWQKKRESSAQCSSQCSGLGRVNVQYYLVIKQRGHFHVKVAINYQLKLKS